MVDMFHQRKANFVGMVDPNKQLFVSDVIHKAFIEVNEDGAETAAGCESLNHMFIVLILKSILFLNF